MLRSKEKKAIPKNKLQIKKDNSDEEKIKLEASLKEKVLKEKKKWKKKKLEEKV